MKEDTFELMRGYLGIIFITIGLIIKYEIQGVIW